MKNIYQSKIIYDLNKIVSNKKVSVNEKVNLLLDAYKSYMYNGCFEEEVKCIVETKNAYSYMKNGEVDKGLYEIVYANVEENLLFNQAVTLFENILELKNKGASFENISNKDKQMIYSLVVFDNKFGEYNRQTGFFFLDSKARKSMHEKLYNFKAEAKFASFATYEQTSER